MKYLILCIIIFCSVKSHALDQDKMKSKADSILRNYVGECIFESFVSLDSIGMYTETKGEFSGSEVHWVRYQVKPYNEAVQQISLKFNTSMELIGSIVETPFVTIRSPRFDKKQIVGTGQCNILSAEELHAVIEKNKQANTAYRNKKAKAECLSTKIDVNDIYLTEHGLTYQYHYDSNARNKACVGEVLINVHTGEEIINRTTCYNF